MKYINKSLSIERVKVKDIAKKFGTPIYCYSYGQLKENINNFLKPYFTTKKKGTGLGLAIVNKIINDHNGSIDFISIINGARIEITFIK